MATTQVMISLIFLSVLSPSLGILSNETMQQVAESLTRNGYNSMALTLEFGPRSLVSSPYSTLTIFAVQDAAFSLSGQPSIALLFYHISPLYIPISYLKSFPSGTKIPTLSPKNSLTITHSPSGALNGVNLDGPSIYDDGQVVIYGVETFFDMGFNDSAASAPTPSGSAIRPNGGEGLQCTARGWEGSQSGHGRFSFDAAVEVLRGRGYTFAAAFLDLQLRDFKDTARDDTLVTIFAPVDSAIMGSFREHRLLRPLALRHVLPCRLPMRVLSGLQGGTMLPTYLEGFTVNVTKNGDGLVLANGRLVIDFDMYSNSWLTVHGIAGVLLSQEEAQGVGGRNSGAKISLSFEMLVIVVAAAAVLCFPYISMESCVRGLICWCWNYLL